MGGNYIHAPQGVAAKVQTLHRHVFTAQTPHAKQCRARTFLGE
jgi:hypothetical protein